MDMIGHENIASDVNAMASSRFAEANKNRMDGWPIQDHLPVKGAKGDKVDWVPEVYLGKTTQARLMHGVLKDGGHRPPLQFMALLL
jgi:hypothetical protein